MPVIDADAVSRTLTQTPDSEALRQIRQTFGDAVIDSAGCLNRAAMREYVFADEQARQRLEAILHPLIYREIERQKAACTERIKEVFMLSFDHPLSERVRSLIRIDHLFNRFNHNVESDDKWSHHVALSSLFEIMECSSRAELKLDILQELERQRQAVRHRDNPAILDRIQRASQDLQDVQQKFGQHLRENEWLMSLKQRIVMAGGTTPVELPSYYYWQKQPATLRRADLQRWSQVMMPTYHATKLLLEILRSNQRVMMCKTQKANYEHTSLAKNIHLLTVEIPQAAGVLPEVSANKYFTHIRFVQANQESMRGKPVEKDLEFKMMICSFDSEAVA